MALRKTLTVFSVNVAFFLLTSSGLTTNILFIQENAGAQRNPGGIVNVWLENESSVAAAQFDVNYDPKVLKLVGFEKTLRTASFYHAEARATEPGRSRFLIFDLNGRELSPETGAIFSLKFEAVSLSDTESTAIVLNNINLSDKDARSIPCLARQGDFKVRNPKDASVVQPQDFSLSQNFPNPFNPSTKISYAVPSGTGVIEVQLRIYNVLGQVVRTLVDDKQSPGYYEILWDGRDDRGNTLPSGIYFYRIKMADYVDSKKMILLK